MLTHTYTQSQIVSAHTHTWRMRNVKLACAAGDARKMGSQIEAAVGVALGLGVAQRTNSESSSVAAQKGGVAGAA